MRDYIFHLQKRTKFADHPTTSTREELLAPTTIQCYIRALKAFFNSLYKEGYNKENNLERLKVPKAPNKLIDPLTDVEIAAILSSIDTHTSWGARNSTIVLLLLDTGLRFSGFLGLDYEDLHLEDTYVKVMGKGQKERIVPFDSSGQNSLMKYIFHFRPEPLREERVVLNLDGSAMTAIGADDIQFRASSSLLEIISCSETSFSTTIGWSDLLTYLSGMNRLAPNAASWRSPKLCDSIKTEAEGVLTLFEASLAVFLTTVQVQFSQWLASLIKRVSIPSWAQDWRNCSCKAINSSVRFTTRSRSGLA